MLGGLEMRGSRSANLPVTELSEAVSTAFQDIDIDFRLHEASVGSEEVPGLWQIA